MLSKKLKKISDINHKYGALLLLLLFALIQYILILRHKSPYISDSYFYKHIFYEMKGDSFNEARAKILSEVDLQNSDEIAINIFEDKKAYENSYSFFTKRPLYPFTARIVDVLVKQEYLAFIIPVFFAYVGSVILNFYFLKIGLTYFSATFTLALFISFYPFLDWSTYFLTDTIGFLFWTMQLIFIYKHILAGNIKWLYFFVLTLAVSLANREQSILMTILLLFVYLMSYLFKFEKKIIKRCVTLLIASIFVSALYILALVVLGKPTIIETIIYTQNQYGLTQNTYKLGETLKYWFETITLAHFVFIADLTRHHWWFTFFAISLMSIFKTLSSVTKKRFIDLLVLASGVASYLAIFFYPVLSYRFFYPVVIMIVYFSSKFIFEFFEDRQKLIQS